MRWVCLAAVLAVTSAAQAAEIRVISPGVISNSSDRANDGLTWGGYYSKVADSPLAAPYSPYQLAEGVIGELEIGKIPAALATGVTTGAGGLGDVATGVEMTRIQVKNADEISGYVWSPDGTRVAIGTRGDGAVRIWDWRTHQELKKIAFGSGSFDRDRAFVFLIVFVFFVGDGFLGGPERQSGGGQGKCGTLNETAA